MKNNKSKIKYADLYGLRKEKYKFLKNHNVKNTKWQNLEIEKFDEKFLKTRWSKKYSSGFYFFSPKMGANIIAYGNFLGIDEIFEKYNAGIATGKDDVLVDFNKQSLISKLSIRDKSLFEIAMQNYGVKKDLVEKWCDELKNINVEDEIKDYNYRIFDKRKVIYNNTILQRSRHKLMDNLISDNISLITTKILSSDKFQHSFVSDCIGDRCYISNLGREANYYFPLYLYNQNNYAAPKKQEKNLGYGTMMMFDAPAKLAKQPNIKKEILEMLKIKYKKAVKPEEVFNYIYTILYSNKYREKYQEFLKIDFPRVPFTKDYKLFQEFGKLGKELIDLHLLKSKKLNKTISKFCGIGLNEVEKREYIKKEKKLYINDKQHFTGIDSEIWEYYIGGYQILDKWIKDRIGKNLSREEVEHYLKVITSLRRTVELQKKIDGLYLKVEKNLIK